MVTVLKVALTPSDFLTSSPIHSAGKVGVFLAGGPPWGPPQLVVPYRHWAL